jgi:hypothetical protein
LKHIKPFKLYENYLKDMKSFGLSKNDIDDNGYITLYHGGKSLPKKLNKDEIFFMTPYYDEAKDYANMRKGEVFTLKVNPKDVNWNQGSYEVEYTKGGEIINGTIYPPKSKIKFGTNKKYDFNDPWGKEDFRSIKKYENVKIGDILPKTKWKVQDIIQYKSNNVQFLLNGKLYEANAVIKYEF